MTLRQRAHTRRLLLRIVAVTAATAILAGCGSQAGPATDGSSSAVASGPVSGSPSPGLVPTAPPSGPPSSTPTSTTAPPPTAVPAPTGTLSAGFGYGDVLKVGVNNLAVREQPKRSAPLVHGYELDGPAPIDHGLVRLDKGQFVSVHLGPITAGQTAWYLVWPTKSGTIHDSPIDWWTEHPSEGSPGPGWMATQVGDDVYATLHRRPGMAELETLEPLGLNAAGTGPFVSAPQPRHDGWTFTWAIATPVPETSCTARIQLVPADGDFEPVTVLETTTGGVKVSPVAGLFKTAPWLPASAGSWETFTLEVSGTCRWAVRLTPLHHD